MLTLVVFGSACALSALAEDVDFTCGKAVPEMAQLAPGAVKPSGWLRDIACAVRDGYTAHMDGPIVLAKRLPAKDANTPLEPNATLPVVSRAAAEAAEVVRTSSSVCWDRPDASPVKLTLKDAGGAPLELVPYGLAKFRITMFLVP